MSQISIMPSKIVAWLQAHMPIANLSYLTEFPAKSKQVPLKDAIAVVGIERIELEDSFVKNADGVLERQEYCRSASIRLKLNIYVPYSQGGERCHELFSRILDRLTFDTDLGIVKSGCEKVHADRDTDAFVLNGWADLQADFCPAEGTGVSYESFFDKELLCGSHVRDKTLHFQDAAEKDLALNPVMFGSYYGNGETTRTIPLTPTPRMLFVFAQKHPPVTADFSVNSYAVYWGMATPYGANTQGLEITETGFRLLSTASQVMKNCQPRLNENNVLYNYVVIR